MKVAIISDAHGNLEATEAVLADIEKNANPDEIWFLGDSVGYGPQPSEVLSLIRENASIILRGNHDTALFDPQSFDDLNPRARVALEWTKERIGEQDVDFLRKLPVFREDEENRVLLCHASPHEPSEWHYIFTDEDAERAFSATESPIIITGHSHLPLCFTRKKGITSQVHGPEALSLNPDARYLLNPGSVGQPRDGDPRASYAVLDTEAGRFSVRRVEYDLRAVAKKIADSGLPLFLAERLFVGL
ncbi:MAG: metallophosphoesterase family protein [candidate division WOR-3 bacterium]